MGAERSSEAIDDSEVEERLARGVSEGEISVEGAEEAVDEVVVSERRRGADSDGRAVVVAMLRPALESKQEGSGLRQSLQLCSRGRGSLDWAGSGGGRCGGERERCCQGGKPSNPITKLSWR